MPGGPTRQSLMPPFLGFTDILHLLFVSNIIIFYKVRAYKKVAMHLRKGWEGMGNGKAGLVTKPWSHLWLPQGAHNLTQGERSKQPAMSSRKAASNCCQINKKLKYSLGFSSKLEIDIFRMMYCIQH